MRQAIAYWPVMLVVLAGVIVVGAMSFSSASSGQMLWVGGIIGVVAGGVIAAIQRREDEPRSGKRRKR